MSTLPDIANECRAVKSQYDEDDVQTQKEIRKLRDEFYERGYDRTANLDKKFPKEMVKGAILEYLTLHGFKRIHGKGLWDGLIGRTIKLRDEPTYTCPEGHKLSFEKLPSEKPRCLFDGEQPWFYEAVRGKWDGKYHAGLDAIIRLVDVCEGTK